MFLPEVSRVSTKGYFTKLSICITFQVQFLLCRSASLNMPRATKASGKSRHDPLHVQLQEDELYGKYGNITRPGKRKKTNRKDDEEESADVC